MLENNVENRSLSNEWLITNGIGSYASSTFSGANTRRYHGLLVASFNPPVERKVLVSKMEETIVTPEGNLELGSNFYPGVVYPEGYKAIKSFERSPFPTTLFENGEQLLSKTVFMVHGSNTTVVEYQNKGDEPIDLQLTPLFVNRDYHSLYHEGNDFSAYYTVENNLLEMKAFDHAESVFMSYSAGNFVANNFWHKYLEYPREQERGQDFQEDSFSVGRVEVQLLAGEKVFLLFSTDQENIATDPEMLKENELQRLQSLKPKHSKNKFLTDLAYSADQFVVWRKSTQSYSVIAGYHWFTDWGRDTMIALQGLGILLGKQEISKSILDTFFKSIDRGMLPNRFSDNENDEPEYNTIDASLWLFDTLYKYYQKFGDEAFVRENFLYLEQIIYWNFNGTRYQIQVTDEGFLSGGDGLSQLTWMDARIGDYVVTPRHGMPVEIQALWYNALEVYLFFARKFSEKPDAFQIQIMETTYKLKQNFATFFLNENGYLNDVLNQDKSADNAIRPNQIYSLSLSFPILNKEIGKSILKTVERHLFTPLGLRTLSPEHADFRAFYQGDVWERDTAYHQGTVWPFLLSDYFNAMLYVHGLTPEIKQQLTDCINALKKHFYEDSCLHGISEIFDGENPLQGRGTVQQAWSVSAAIQLVEMQKNSTKKPLKK